MKIGLIGTHSTGKTTTMKVFIEKYSKFKTVIEVARENPYKKLNQRTDYLCQKWILHEQIKRELVNYPFDQISDRTSMDNCAYTEYQFKNGIITYEQYKELVTIAIAWFNTYDHVFLSTIEFPLVKDGVRSEDIQFQKDIELIILDNLKQFDQTNIHKLSGTTEERLKQIEKVIYHG